ncbi:MAG: HAD-IIIC family phosphatase, partial [Alphaproteobacteria bacterium]
ETIEPFLKLHLYRAGLRPAIRFGGYDTIRQDVVGPDSILAAAPGPDLVVLALVLDRLDPGHLRPGWTADHAMGEVKALLGALAERTEALVAVNTVLAPWYEAGIGIQSAGDYAAEIARLNRCIAEEVRAHGGQFLLVDWERPLRLLGREAAIDERYWYRSRAPFKPAFLDLYAREIAKIVRARKGLAKKCVVLDCDNTLWGGVLGEDLITGIKLDPNDFPGRIYYEFQAGVLRLAARGVMVALCSKNNEADVMEVLNAHPACLIKPKDLAGWRVNWDDKATNLRRLASDLNIGLDAMVFVDDDKMECGLVRDLVPDVTVLEVPHPLYPYPDLLFRDGLFDTLSVSDEDRRRTQMYQAECRRQHEAARFESLEDYLASLDMAARIWRAEPGDVARVAQLTQKTNQFNLTTRRYSESEIARFRDSPDHAVYCLSLADRFGDSGLTGVLIAAREGDAVRIDTLLLSCRILGRRVELAFVDHVLADLKRRWKPARFEALYLPTAKNPQVAQFWENFGLAATPGPDGAKSYAADAAKIADHKVPFVCIEAD